MWLLCHYSGLAFAKVRADRRFEIRTTLMPGVASDGYGDSVEGAKVTAMQSVEQAGWVVDTDLAEMCAALSQ